MGDSDEDDASDDDQKPYDETSGQFVPEYADDEFLDAARDLGPAAGTQEIAERVGCQRDTAYRRLRMLEDDERIESRKVGMARLWTVVDDE